MILPDLSSTHSQRSLRRWLVGLVLLAASSVAFAGPGFIESARVSGQVSGDALAADIEVRFNCKAQYLHHDPQESGDRLRIYLDPTGICNGVSPIVAESRSRLRPFNADDAQLIDLEYDGESTGEPVLVLNFGKPVTFDVEMASVAFALVVHVRSAPDQAPTEKAAPAVSHRQVVKPAGPARDVAINLKSLRRVPTIADIPGLEVPAGKRVYYSELDVSGASWYRLRLGDFASVDDASVILAGLKADFPDAWIDAVDAADDKNALTNTALQPTEQERPKQGSDDAMVSKADALMQDARKAMVAGETSRAIQIYTKILQLPGHARHPEAQEFLALAREKNGQMAHAKAEYQRFLSLYPDNDGAARVGQRLAALLANDRQADRNGDVGKSANKRPAARQSDWRLQTYISQYYRRDANQQNDQEQILSQSALYSDLNFDARRRGERFDFSSRLSAGYRKDFLDEEAGSGDSTRVSYAYVDLTDAATGLRGRIGRQSRNTGGVLGRFDGINVGYKLNERILLSTVAGKPAYSTSNGVDSSRSFYGASANYSPESEALDLGIFYVDQKIDGIQDRRAVGAEFRYFGTNQNLWGTVDYDIAYGELASAFLQGSWRLPSRLSIHAHADRRGGPFLSAGNALIGQPVTSFTELAAIYSEDELRQLGRDRTSLSTTYTVGLSYPLTQKLQINADASQATSEGTPASGGVLATQGITYRYYSGSVIASSMLKEGDVSIITARYSDSDTSRIISLTLDSRYPISRSFRINPRLRIDRRQRLAEDNYEWLYTPAVRVQYRRSQKYRIELEAGKQFSQRQTVTADLDRESYYINLGYQSFF